MSHLPTTDRKADVAKAGRKPDAPSKPDAKPKDQPKDEQSVLEIAERREKFAPPQTTIEIADWVNEGGAGGEVRR